MVLGLFDDGADANGGGVCRAHRDLAVQGDVHGVTDGVSGTRGFGHSRCRVEHDIAAMSAVLDAPSLWRVASDGRGDR